MVADVFCGLNGALSDGTVDVVVFPVDSFPSQFRKGEVTGWTSKLRLDMIFAFSPTSEPRHEKTNVLHMRKQRRRSASR